MGVRNWMAASAAAMACALAGQAQATIYTLTVTGTVSGQPDVIGGRLYGPTDGDGVFGPVNASLAGDPYTAVFTIDSTLGQQVQSNLKPQLWLTGGAALVVTSPITSAELTINGKTLSFSPGWEDEIYYNTAFQMNGKTSLQAVGQVWDQSGEELTAGENAFSSFSTADGGTAALLSEGVASISPDIPAVAIPEPSTWTMLILGVGLLGCALRRRSVGVLRAT